MKSFAAAALAATVANAGIFGSGCDKSFIPACEDPCNQLRGGRDYVECMTYVGCFNKIDWTRRVDYCALPHLNLGLIRSNDKDSTKTQGNVGDGCNWSNVPACEDPTSVLRQQLGHKTYTTCMSSIGCWDYINWGADYLN